MSSPEQAPAVRPLTGKIVALLAGLAAIGMLSTNIILPAFPEMGRALGVSTRELGLTLSAFFITFAFGQLAVGQRRIASDGRNWSWAGWRCLSPAACWRAVRTTWRR